MSFTQLTPEMVLEIYRMGCFPMAESADDDHFEIFEARERSLLPFQHLHVPRSLKKKILQRVFDVRINTAFDDVIDACAENVETRPESWINTPIRNVFKELHRLGHAHSVECFREDKLVGGLYGLQIGGAFCGESMFSRATDASKVALVYLCAVMERAGFTLLDAQLPNPHLAQFGQYMVPRDEYLALLEVSMHKNPIVTVNNEINISIVVDYLNKKI
jgi:leucyl/phenylalanyl-tRNA--protein transferase